MQYFSSDLLSFSSQISFFSFCIIFYFFFNSICIISSITFSLGFKHYGICLYFSMETYAEYIDKTILFKLKLIFFFSWKMKHFIFIHFLDKISWINTIYSCMNCIKHFFLVFISRTHFILAELKGALTSKRDSWH